MTKRDRFVYFRSFLFLFLFFIFYSFFTSATIFRGDGQLLEQDRGPPSDAVSETLRDEGSNGSLRRVQDTLIQDLTGRDAKNGLTINRPRDIPSEEEVVYYGRKYANHTNVFVNAIQYVSCAWKPDRTDDGNKTCEVLFEVENNHSTRRPVLSTYTLTMNFTTPLDNAGITYNFSNASYLVNETIFHNETNYTILTVRKYTNFTSLPRRLDTRTPFVIKATYSIPKYSSNSFNFTFFDSATPSNFNVSLDPDQSACGNLASAGTYTLTQSVNTTGTCFTFQADSITLDCKGYAINYSSNATIGNGVRISGYDNAVVQNCIISEGTPTGNSKTGISIYNASTVTLYNNSITTVGQTSYPISLESVSYANVTKNIVNASGSGTRGIYLFKESNHSVIISNTVNGTSLSNIRGITPQGFNHTILYNHVATGGRALSCGGSRSNNISYNSFFTPSNSGYAVNLDNCNSSYFYANSIETSGSSSYPLSFDDFSYYNTFVSNFLNSSGSSSHALIFPTGFTSSHNIFIENNVSAHGASASALYISGVPFNNTFFNTNFSSDSFIAINDVKDAGYNNSLIFNHSYGMVNWTLGNLTTNLSILAPVNPPLLFEFNKIGFIDSSSALNLNGSAQIQIYQITNTSTPSLFKNDLRCDTNASLCAIVNYSAASANSGILIANVSSFSNYTLNTSIVSSTPSTESSSTTTAPGGGAAASASESAPADASEEKIMEDIKQNIETVLPPELTPNIFIISKEAQKSILEEIKVEHSSKGDVKATIETTTGGAQLSFSEGNLINEGPKLDIYFENIKINNELLKNKQKRNPFCLRGYCF